MSATPQCKGEPARLGDGVASIAIGASARIDPGRIGDGMEVITWGDRKVASMPRSGAWQHDGHVQAVCTLSRGAELDVCPGGQPGACPRLVDLLRVRDSFARHRARVHLWVERVEALSIIAKPAALKAGCNRQTAACRLESEIRAVAGPRALRSRADEPSANRVVVKIGQHIRGAPVIDGLRIGAVSKHRTEAVMPGVEPTRHAHVHPLGPAAERGSCRDEQQVNVTAHQRIPDQYPVAARKRLTQPGEVVGALYLSLPCGTGSGNLTSLSCGRSPAATRPAMRRTTSRLRHAPITVTSPARWLMSVNAITN